MDDNLPFNLTLPFSHYRCVQVALRTYLLGGVARLLSSGRILLAHLSGQATERAAGQNLVWTFRANGYSSTLHWNSCMDCFHN